MSEQPKTSGVASQAHEGASATSSKIDELRASVAKAYHSFAERLDGYIHSEGEGSSEAKQRLVKLKEQAADAYHATIEKIDALVAGSGKGIKEGASSGASAVQQVGERTGEGLSDLEHKITDVCGQAKTRFDELLASTRK